MTSGERTRPHTRPTLINFNNAGSSRPVGDALEAQIAHLRLEADVGGYEAAHRAAPLVDRAYEAIASLVGGATPDDVAFMDSATRAWNYLLYSVRLRPGDVILSARSEFSTNVVTLAHVARRAGASLVLARSEEDGRISLDDVRRKLTDRVALVAVSHVPGHRGVVNPVDEIGRLVRDQGRALYLVDGSQAAGQLPVDIGAIGCHAYTGTGRKWLRGPRGTGFLYAERSTVESTDPVVVDADAASVTGDVEGEYALRVLGTARRFETWERSVAGFVGLGVAVRAYLDGDPERVRRMIGRNAAAVREGLAEQGHTLYEDVSAPNGIVTFAPRRGTAEQTKSTLASRGFAVSTVHRENAPIDFADRGLDSIVRVSPHAYNTEDEVVAFLQAMRHIAVRRPGDLS